MSIPRPCGSNPRRSPDARPSRRTSDERRKGPRRAADTIAAVRSRAAVLGLGVALLASACGSSGSPGPPWDTVGEAQARGTSPGFIDNVAIGRPSQLELRLAATPATSVRATYSLICGSVSADKASTRTSPLVRTPATIRLSEPPGPPGACRMNLLAQKSSAASLTVTLLMRSGS